MERLRKWNKATSVLPSMVKGINWTQQASINQRNGSVVVCTELGSGSMDLMAGSWRILQGKDKYYFCWQSPIITVNDVGLNQWNKKHTKINRNKAYNFHGCCSMISQRKSAIKIQVPNMTTQRCSTSMYFLSRWELI